MTRPHAQPQQPPEQTPPLHAHNVRVSTGIANRLSFKDNHRPHPYQQKTNFQERKSSESGFPVP